MPEPVSDMTKEMLVSTGTPVAPRAGLKALKTGAAASVAFTGPATLLFGPSWTPSHARIM